MPMIERVKTIDSERALQYDLLGHGFMMEAKLPGRFNLSNFVNSWEQFLQTGIGALWDSRIGNEVVGAIGAIKFPDLYTGDLHVTELFWFVKAKFRYGTQGMRLFLELGKWVEQLRARRLIMVSLEGLNTKRMDQFYLEHQFIKCETHWMRDFVWQ